MPGWKHITYTVKLSNSIQSRPEICHSFDRPIRVYFGKDALKLNQSYPSDEYDFIQFVTN